MYTIDQCITILEGDTSLSRLEAQSILEHLKELKGLAAYHIQLGHELAQQTKRHRKLTHTDAVDIAAGAEVGKVTIAEADAEWPLPGGMAQALAEGYLGGSPQNEGLEPHK
jgi:hypothetical protein